MCFSAEKKVLWENIGQIHKELIHLYNKAYGDFPVGQALYYQHLHFCCPTKIYDQKIIREIKGIKYCMDSGTPPYKTLKDTPFEFIQKFEIYNTELGMIRQDAKEKELEKSK
tara:strand:+ start:2740 stop:3075 length:336 start_codon:yes stop_codon:yes gene_type:complete